MFQTERGLINPAIQYTPKVEKIVVRLEGRVVGVIYQVVGGWQYIPVNYDTGGDTYKTLEACQRSIEAD